LCTTIENTQADLSLFPLHSRYFQYGNRDFQQDRLPVELGQVNLKRLPASAQAKYKATLKMKLVSTSKQREAEAREKLKKSRKSSSPGSRPKVPFTPLPIIMRAGEREADLLPVQSSPVPVPSLARLPLPLLRLLHHL
jgi:hypothetical protein